MITAENLAVIEEFDPLSEKFVNSPWTEFKRMRESCRAYRHVGTLMPVVSFFRDSDLREIRADWETWSSTRLAESNKHGLRAGALMVGQDPPDHTKYRNIIAPMFMPGRIGALQPAIDGHVKKLLDHAIDAGEIDFMEDIGGALATATIGTICGIPEQDWPLIREITVIFARDYGKAPLYKEPQPEVEARLREAEAKLLPFIVSHIQNLRKSNTPSILLDVADQVEDNFAVMGLCALIIGAGVDTSANLMVNGLWELMQKPDQMQWLRNNPDKINQAVEECIRCRGSLRRSERVAARDLEFDGVQINRGDTVMIWNASASRDPEVVPDRPDEFDIQRAAKRHMGFGAGIHMCIGNVLARLEARTLYGELIKRTSRIEEMRGADSYEHWGNGVTDAAKRYSVSLLS